MQLIHYSITLIFFTSLIYSAEQDPTRKLIDIIKSIQRMTSQKEIGGTVYQVDIPASMILSLLRGSADPLQQGIEEGRTTYQTARKQYNSDANRSNRVFRDAEGNAWLVSQKVTYYDDLANIFGFHSFVNLVDEDLPHPLPYDVVHVVGELMLCKDKLEDGEEMLVKDGEEVRQIMHDFKLSH